MALAFSTTDKSATVAISGTGDTIATNTGTVVAKAVRTTVSKSTGKWVFALTCTTMATGNDMALGLATTGHPLATRLHAATTAFAVDYGGIVESNSTYITTVGGWAQGDKIYVAVDLSLGHVWIKVGSGGNWNNNPSANPDTDSAEFNLPSGVNGATLFPVASFWNSNGVWTLDPTASGHGLSSFSVWDTTAQTLSPSLFTNSSTFHPPTLTRGAVSLAPPVITNGSALYGPTVSQGPQSLVAPLLTNASAIHAATVVPGGVTLSPAQLANSGMIHAATVGRGTITLGPGLLSNTSTLHASAVSLLSGGQSLTPGRLDGANAFFPPTVTQPSLQSLAPARLSSASLIYFAAVRQADTPGTYPLAITGGGSVLRGRLIGGGAVSAGFIPRRGRVIAAALRGRP